MDGAVRPIDIDEARAGPSTSREEEHGNVEVVKVKVEVKVTRRPVPFEYFVSLLACIAAINEPEWPFGSAAHPTHDLPYRNCLRHCEPKLVKLPNSNVRRGVRQQAVRDATKKWIAKLPDGDGPGPQACQPGSCAAILRLLFPEEDVRRRYGMREPKLIPHLVRALGVSYTDAAAQALHAWAEPDISGKTTGSGCLALEFARQLKKLGHEEQTQSVTTSPDRSAGGASKAAKIWGTLTVQQVDILLDELAAWSTFTDPAIRACWVVKDEASSKGPKKAPAPDLKLSFKPRRALDVLVPGKQTRAARWKPLKGSKGSRASPRLGKRRARTSSTSFKLYNERPTPATPQQARTPTEILGFLLSNQLSVRSRTYIIQIILKDLDAVLYPLPHNPDTLEVLDAQTALRQHNTKSIHKLTLNEAMKLWHPLMPSLWRVRYGSGFEHVGSEVERLFNEHPVSHRVASVKATAKPQPELFTFVQMPKSQKTVNCIAAVGHLGHAGVIWAEQKYDGERFQVHAKFDEAGAPPEIKIFSKSQRDSTLDRSQTHAIVLAALGRDPSLSRHPFHSQLAAASDQRPPTDASAQKRQIQSNVILEAEMVAFDADGRVAEFHKIASIKGGVGWLQRSKERKQPSNDWSARDDQDRRCNTSLSGAEGRYILRSRAAQHARKKKERAADVRRLDDGGRQWSESSKPSDLSEDEDDSTPLRAMVSQISDLSVDGDFHLGLVFFDVLYIDGQSLLDRSYDHRRAVLEAIVHPVPAFAMLAERTKIDFGPLEHAQERWRKLAIQLGRRPTNRDLLPVLEADATWKTGMRDLILAFARSHARREEGLMLKAADGPYAGGTPHEGRANLSAHEQQWISEPTDVVDETGQASSAHRGAWVKLKADYIRGLGDTIDMIVVGAGWSAKRARELRVGTDAPTSLFVAARVDAGDIRPRLRSWFTVEYGLTRHQLGNLVSSIQTGKLPSVPFSTKNLQQLPYELELGTDATPTLLFPEPFAVDVSGGGFTKATSDAYYTLRWPRITKVHAADDRTWQDVPSFEEFQRTAVKAVRALATDAELEEAFQSHARQLVNADGLPWLSDAIKSSRYRQGDGTKGPIAPDRADRNELSKKRKRAHDSPHILSSQPNKLAEALQGEAVAARTHANDASKRKMGVLAQRIYAPQRSSSPDWVQLSNLESSPVKDSVPPRPPSPPPSSPIGPPHAGVRARVDECERSGLSPQHRATAPRPGQAEPIGDTTAPPLPTPPSSGQVQLPSRGSVKAGPEVAPSAAPTRTAPRARACTTTPRLMDTYVYFHSNIPKNVQDVFRPLLLPHTQISTIEAVIDAVIPVQMRPRRSHAGEARPRLCRSRSFDVLSGTRLQGGQPTAIIVMDTRDEAALSFMYQDIRRRVEAVRRRLAPSLSAPEGLSVKAGRTTTTAERGTDKHAPPAPRKCLSATNEYLAGMPVVVLDPASMDLLAVEQWDCFEGCRERGEAAARGACECCPHIDLVLTTLARIDPATRPSGLRDRRVAKGC